MLWLTLRQLRNGTAGARKKAAQELWREPNPGALSALSSAVLTDSDPEVRRLAASALGRLQDPGRYEPLRKALNDKDPEVIKSALFALRRASDEQAIRALLPLLRHKEFTVRTTTAQTIDTIRWVPADKDQRVWFQVAKGWYERAATAGLDAVTPLELTVQTGPVHAAIRAVDALGKIPEERVVSLLRICLKSSEPGVCMAAAGALGKIGGPTSVEALIGSLISTHTQVRVASVQALGSLGAVEATGLICKMLGDREWEVRQEAASALGKLNNKEALEPLAKTLEDSDADVRETAAMALGRLRDRRSVTPLVLALRDEVTAVRRIAAASLSRIDPDWVSLPETRAAAGQLKVAIQDADPAVRFFVAQLLVNMGEISAESISGFAPDEQLTSPATKRKRMATSLFVSMLEDSDRDVRQAAAEALGHLGGERARQALNRNVSDPDGDVAAAAQIALQALGTETTS